MGIVQPLKIKNIYKGEQQNKGAVKYPTYNWTMKIHTTIGGPYTLYSGECMKVNRLHYTPGGPLLTRAIQHRLLLSQSDRISREHSSRNKRRQS